MMRRIIISVRYKRHRHRHRKHLAMTKYGFEKKTTKIRNLFSPSLYGKYEAAIYFKKENNDEIILEQFRNLIPRKFKVSYHPIRTKTISNIRCIYIVHMDDLFFIKLALEEHILCVKRIVNEKVHEQFDNHEYSD